MSRDLFLVGRTVLRLADHGNMRANHDERRASAHIVFPLGVCHGVSALADGVSHDVAVSSAGSGTPRPPGVGRPVTRDEVPVPRLTAYLAVKQPRSRRIQAEKVYTAKRAAAVPTRPGWVFYDMSYSANASGPGQEGRITGCRPFRGTCRGTACGPRPPAPSGCRVCPSCSTDRWKGRPGGGICPRPRCILAQGGRPGPS